MDTLAKCGVSGSASLINLMVNMQWDREELWFNFVAAKCKFCFPISINLKASSAPVTLTSFNPIKY